MRGTFRKNGWKIALGAGALVLIALAIGKVVHKPQAERAPITLNMSSANAQDFVDLVQER